MPKPVIDQSAYRSWSSVQQGVISNDGKYALYVIRQRAAANREAVDQFLAVQSTDGTWQTQIPCGSEAPSASFSPDSQYVVFAAGTRLGILRVGSEFVDYVAEVKSYQLARGGTGSSLVYLRSTNRELVIRNLATKEEATFPSVEGYVLSANGKALVIHERINGSGKPVDTLIWTSLPGVQGTTIWSGNGLHGIVFDRSETRVAFDADELVNGVAQRSIWFYAQNDSVATALADHRTVGLLNGEEVAGINRFSADGKQLFISLQQHSESLVPTADAVRVHVWGYRDAKLSSQQRFEAERGPDSVSVAIRLSDHHLVRLQQRESEAVVLNHDQGPFGSGEFADDYAIVEDHGSAGAGEGAWNGAYRNLAYRESLRDGSRLGLPCHDGTCVLSPKGTSVVYYDNKNDSFWVLRGNENVPRPISGNLHGIWSLDLEGIGRPGLEHATRGVAAWIAGETSVLIYDRNDIWQLDLSGHAAPVNLTNGYGQSHHIVFDLLESESGGVLRANAFVILSAFNTTTKDNGFFRLNLGVSSDPVQLTMGPFLYYAPTIHHLPTGAQTMSPVKARDADVYLMLRSSATESPNYFATKDFNTLTALSNVHPEKQYNWFTSELHSWKPPDGTELQGVLYKPEDFDPTRQYPVILNYYERMSDGLNAYIDPELNACNINIASYVSNGYLVFTPDIAFTSGHTGSSALKAVLSAAHYLAGMPFVDGTKMALDGCSFGGFETGYLVTHTQLFAAAVAESGLYDFISGYGSLQWDGRSTQDMFENGQNRIGATLWERQDLYLENSAVLQADRVTTPILLMHTTKDGGTTSFAQAVEFFTALRRLGRKAWMLQYDEGVHGLYGKSAEDFEFRRRQFLDHYLKGAPPPVWMTSGVAARREGIDTGLALDSSGAQP